MPHMNLHRFRSPWSGDSMTMAETSSTTNLEDCWGREPGMRSRNVHLIINRYPFIGNPPRFPLVFKAFHALVVENYPGEGNASKHSPVASSWG